MFPGQFPGHLSGLNNQNFLQAIHAQHLQQQLQAAASRENQSLPASSNVHRQQQSQIPSTTANQSQQMAYLAAIQQQLTQEQQNKAALAQQISLPHHIQTLLGGDLSRLHPQQLQLLQNQLHAASAASLNRSSYPAHNNAPQMGINNLIKQEPKQMYGLTSGVPYRSAANNLSVPGSGLMRTPDTHNTSPAPNRGNNLLSNFHPSQTTTHLPIDGPKKQELSNVRDSIEKVTEEHKQLESQFTTVTKRKQHLIQMLEHRKEEMKREREEAEAAAILRAHAEANKKRVSLADSIVMENRQQAEKNRPPERLLPKTNFCHNLEAISENYRRLAPLLIRSMTKTKLETQRKQNECLAEYEDKYMTWSRRVEKFEKTPKKIAKDQKNRELFEKIFPEIKREREEKERNDRHERNNVGEEQVKSIEEKAAERACHVPLYCRQKPKHEFINNNNEVDEQELKNVNDNISTFLSYWTPAEKSVFLNKIRVYWKNFHVLSHFYWDKTACDMVEFYYATKTEMKYKLTFPKTKKKVAKSYKPTPMPDFREMFDHLMSTCNQKNNFKKLPCLICSNDVHLFGDVLPKMKPEKEKLRRKILKEQEYREKMPICNKCYNLYKKTSLRCPVVDCSNGRRKNKPSRALPTEFVELPVEEQSLIVRKLQFHPSTPKICNNCYKRILVEIKCIRSNTFTIDAALQDKRPTDNKKQLKWPFDRVEILFRSVSETDKNWESVAQQVCTDNFKPSARQCRMVYSKLSSYWHIKKRRVYLEKSSRKLRRMYRRIKRATRLEHERNKKARLAIESRKLSKLNTQLASKNDQQLTSPNSRPQHGSITQGIPVARTPTTTTPLLTNFIPSTAQSSISTGLPSSVNQLGIQFQLTDKKWEDCLLQELGIPKSVSSDDNAAEISRRVNQMTPYEFEMLSNRLKARTQQDQEASALAKFKEMHRHQFEQAPPSREQDLRFGEQVNKNQVRQGQLDNAQNANAPSVLQYSATVAKPTTPDEASRQATTGSAERPNRKTGLANVMLESNNSGFRSRTHTLQKTTINRPSSAFDAQQSHGIKTEPVDTSLDSDDLKLRQRAASQSSYQMQQQQRQPPVNLSTPSVAANSVDEPAYEELSDDDDAPNSKSAKESNSSASAQKPRWNSSYQTIFNLVDQDRTNIPPCLKHLQMPAIENLGIYSPYYEDLSD